MHIRGPGSQNKEVAGLSMRWQKAVGDAANLSASAQGNWGGHLPHMAQPLPMVQEKLETQHTVGERSQFKIGVN